MTDERTYATEQRDKQIPGLVLRTQTATGRQTWYVQIRRGVRYKLGDKRILPVAEARKLARQYLLAGGPPVEGKPTPTLSAWIEEQYRPRFHGNKQNLLNFTPAVLGKLGDRRLNEINADAIAGWILYRKRQGVSDATIRRGYNAIRGALSRAVQWGDLPAHPLLGVKGPSAPKDHRVRYLSPDERGKLEAALDWYAGLDDERRNPYAVPMIRLALSTGMRRGELLNLRWADVDLDAQALHVAAATTKSKRSRTIPLNDSAIAALRAVKREDGALYVFGGADRLGAIKRSWQTIIDRAGLADFTFHCLRHDLASRLVQRGVPLQVVREILGHSDIGLTLRYAHLAPGAARRALGELE